MLNGRPVSTVPLFASLLVGAACPTLPEAAPGPSRSPLVRAARVAPEGCARAPVRPEPLVLRRRRAIDARDVEAVLARAAPSWSVADRVALGASIASGPIAPALVLGLIEVESAFRADAESVRGARGLTQLLPSTARALVERDGPGAWRGAHALAQPTYAVALASRYLVGLAARFDDGLETTLAAYAFGPTRVARLRRSGRAPSLTQSRYVARVRAAATRFAQALAAAERARTPLVRRAPSDAPRATSIAEPRTASTRAHDAPSANARRSAAPRLQSRRSCPRSIRSPARRRTLRPRRARASSAGAPWRARGSAPRSGAASRRASPSRATCSSPARPGPADLIRVSSSRPTRALASSRAARSR